MKGDEKIDGEVKALNDASMAFATLIEKMRVKLNRDWDVQIDDGGALQKSYFIASEKDVKLVLRRQDFADSATSTLTVVALKYDGEDITCRELEISATDNGAFEP
jgi:hypothetical protein